MSPAQDCVQVGSSEVGGGPPAGGRLTGAVLGRRPLGGGRWECTEYTGWTLDVSVSPHGAGRWERGLEAID